MKKFEILEHKADLKIKVFGEDIKAVTYHSLDVRQKKNGGWEATVLFDI